MTAKFLKLIVNDWLSLSSETHKLYELKSSILFIVSSYLDDVHDIEITFLYFNLLIIETLNPLFHMLKFNKN